jgi:hypothetical protein
VFDIKKQLRTDVSSLSFITGQADATTVNQQTGHLQLSLCLGRHLLCPRRKNQITQFWFLFFVSCDLCFVVKGHKGIGIGSETPTNIWTVEVEFLMYTYVCVKLKALD